MANSHLMAPIRALIQDPIMAPIWGTLGSVYELTPSQNSKC